MMQEASKRNNNNIAIICFKVNFTKDFNKVVSQLYMNIFSECFTSQFVLKCLETKVEILRNL